MGCNIFFTLNGVFDLSMDAKIDLKWFQHQDVTYIARHLLGKMLCTNIGGQVTKGMIVETEAYSGQQDKACHANNHRMTKRNKVMFEAGGLAYIYLCYGIHHLFNVVTNIKGRADAVLVRAVEPIEGINAMLQRRNMLKVEKRLTSGPGVLTEALGIKTSHYGTALNSNLIWIENAPVVLEEHVMATRRIGVDYAEEDALKPWRFIIKENKWVSRN